MDVLLALALDLLAQAEAHHRAASRLEIATRGLATTARDRRGSQDPASARQVREQLTALQKLASTHRNLLSEFARELDAVAGRASGA